MQACTPPPFAFWCPKLVPAAVGCARPALFLLSCGWGCGWRLHPFASPLASYPGVLVVGQISTGIAASPILIVGHTATVRLPPG